SVSVKNLEFRAGVFVNSAYFPDIVIAVIVGRNKIGNLEIGEFIGFTHTAREIPDINLIIRDFDILKSRGTLPENSVERIFILPRRINDYGDGIPVDLYICNFRRTTQNRFERKRISAA